MKRLTNKKGFTIIEIIVVMAVLSILVLLAMSRFTGYTQKAKEVKIKNDIKTLENELQIYKYTNNKLPFDWENIHYEELKGTKLYNKRELLENIPEKEYEKISYEFVNKAGVHSGGTFYVDNKDNVYYEENVYCETYIDVTEHGVLGDNMTDNFLTLQNLMNSLNQTDSCYNKIYFPKGVYLISKQINIPSNVLLYGENKDSIIKLIDNAGDTNLLYSEDTENIKIQNLTLDGNIENQENIHAHTTCIQFHIVKNLYLTDLIVKGSLIEGVYLYKNENFIIDNIVAYNNGHPGIDASGLHIDNSKHGQILNIETYKNGFHGILISDSNNLKIDNLVAYENSYDGVRVQWQANENIFTNIKAHSNLRGIYFIEESNNNTVYNSSFNYNKGNGISSNNSQENEFINVHSSYNEGHGVETVTENDIIYYDNLHLENNVLPNELAPGSKFIQY